jgi:hypothetical protein
MGLPNATDANGNTGSQVWSKFFDPTLGRWSDWFPLGPNVFPSLALDEDQRTRPHVTARVSVPVPAGTP